MRKRSNAKVIGGMTATEILILRKDNPHSTIVNKMAIMPSVRLCGMDIPPYMLNIVKYNCYCTVKLGFVNETRVNLWSIVDY